MTRKLLGVMLLCLCVDCQPQQWLVSIHTNASVPQFGDRLLVEMLDDQGRLACQDCRRQFGAGDPRFWPWSFGVAPDAMTASGRLHVHAQLFRTDHLDDDVIRGGAFLDSVAKLPELTDEYAATSVALTLDQSCFRVLPRLTPGAFQSCDAVTRELKAETVLTAPTDSMPIPGSWAPGQDVPCQGTTLPGMTCVPGGAFVRGAARYVYATAPEGGSTPDAEPEALTVVSPFALDIEEFQVKQYAALRKSFPALPLPSLKGSPEDWAKLCTATGTAADQDSQASLNCVTQELAAVLCHLQGKRLPTEAEWEFAAGNRTLETLYSWGNSEDVCAYAVIGRAYSALEGPSMAGGGGALDCRVDAAGKQVAPGLQTNGHPADRGLLLNLHNLAGNLAEWVADNELPYKEPCWGRMQLWRNWTVDPLCAVPNAPLAVTRGGEWSSPITEATATYRHFANKSTLFLDPVTRQILPRYYGIGFRCAKDMRPH